MDNLMDYFEPLWVRSAPLFGEDAMCVLRRAHVAVFGLGGVGGYAVEALARAGVGTLTLVDGDRYAPDNLNRQLLATRDTLGWYKTAAAKERVGAINPDCTVYEYTMFYDAESQQMLDFGQFDYVVDAIDTVTSKVLIATKAQEAGVPIISCMSTGNKVDATAFVVDDLYNTKVCPLCRAMRKLCRAAGIERLPVLYSREVPASTSLQRTPATCSFVPGVAGLLLAGQVVKTLTGVWGNGVDLS